jgi:chemotaxis protein histidine kinase CheA
MSQLSCSQFLLLEDDIVADFRECFEENVAAMELCLNQLDRGGEPSAEGIHRLFREIHSLKGNCRMVFLDPLVGCLHAAEEIISEMRTGERAYNPTYGEFFIALVTRLQSMLDTLLHHEELDEDLYQQTMEKINLVRYGSKLECFSALETAIYDFTGEHSLRHELAQGPGPEPTPNLTAPVEPSAPRPPRNDPDLEFFRFLGGQCDLLGQARHKRTDKLLELCLATNVQMGGIVDATQLTAAVLMHDVGMAFVAQAILNKSSRLSPDEVLQIQEHVEIGAQLLKRMPGWEEAAIMVKHHHEKNNGQGYPEGLRGDAIHPGARIIALADTFYSLTHARADRQEKKTLFGAIAVINSESGEQFDPQFVEAFNETVRHNYVAGR